MRIKQGNVYQIRIHCLTFYMNSIYTGYNDKEKESTGERKYMGAQRTIHSEKFIKGGNLIL